MTRMTRARAAEVAETLHVDEDAVLEIPDEKLAQLKLATPPRERSRSPLGELAPNSAESKDLEVNTEPGERQTRGKKAAKKSGKSRKKDLDASTAFQVEGVGDMSREDSTQADGGVDLDVTQDSTEVEQALALERKHMEATV